MQEKKNRFNITVVSPKPLLMFLLRNRVSGEISTTSQMFACSQKSGILLIKFIYSSLESGSVGETSDVISLDKRHSSHFAFVSFYTLFIDYIIDINACWTDEVSSHQQRVPHGDEFSSRHGQSWASPSSLTNVQTTVQSLRPEQVVWTLGKRCGHGASQGDEMSPTALRNECVQNVSDHDVQNIHALNKLC